MNNNVFVRSLLGTLLSLGAGSSLVAQAIADRDNTNPTGWAWYYGQTSAQLSTLVNNTGSRIVDLEVESTNPLTFSAALVANTGTYATGWWWLTNVDSATLGNFIGANDARITDLEVFDVGGATRFAAVLVPNTGQNAKTWWWYANTSIANISTQLANNNARPVDIEQYTIGSTTYYAVVMIRNTGADAKTWWHYYGATPAFITSHLNSTNARIVDFERSGTGVYNFISVRDNVGPWWWVYGVSLQQANDIVGSTGSRVAAFERVGSTFNMLLLNNSNALSTRVSAVMRSESDGVMGAYLKRANGGVLGWLNGDRVFEPASMLKTLHHVHTMKRVLNASASLGQNLNVNTGMTGSCPNDTLPVTETLEVVLSKMMENSDNTRTKAITLFNGGFTPLNNTAAALGMTGTQVNHHIGCGTPANEMTLVDLGRLHEAVVNGYLGGQRQKFYDLMPNSVTGYGDSDNLGSVLAEEATTAGLTALQLASFTSAVEIAWKRGGYGVGGLNYRCYGGWVSLPFYGNGGITMREYVTGAFCVEASSDANAQRAAGRGCAELLRLEIRAAMAAWKDHVFGSLTAFGSGCQGTAGVPLHTVTGIPELGQLLSYSLSSARPSAPVALNFGSSTTGWGAIPLPLDLGFLGAAGCRLYTNPMVIIASSTTAAGARTIGINVPVNPGLIGGTLHTQFTVIDPGANPAALVTTRGYTTRLGGQN